MGHFSVGDLEEQIRNPANGGMRAKVKVHEKRRGEIGETGMPRSCSKRLASLLGIRVPSLSCLGRRPEALCVS